MAATFSPGVQSVKLLSAKTANKVPVTLGEIYKYHERPLTPTGNKGAATSHPGILHQEASKIVSFTFHLHGENRGE